MLHNFTHRLLISSLAKRLEVSILHNVHFLWCMTRRSPHSFSQHFPARKTSTLRFYHCGSHILQNIRETRKITCYLTKPTHISPVLCTVHMVTCSTNRSLGPLAGTTMNPKNSTYEYSCITAPSSIILLLGSPSTYKFYENVNHSPWLTRDMVS
jgi:hypothetical protein